MVTTSSVLNVSFFVCLLFPITVFSSSRCDALLDDSTHNSCETQELSNEIVKDSMKSLIIPPTLLSELQIFRNEENGCKRTLQNLKSKTSDVVYWQYMGCWNKNNISNNPNPINMYYTMENSHGLTWNDCALLAQRAGATFFVLEFPQRYSNGRASCGWGSWKGTLWMESSGGDYTWGGRLQNQDNCSVLDKDGRALGGPDIFAVYEVSIENYDDHWPYLSTGGSGRIAQVGCNSGNFDDCACVLIEESLQRNSLSALNQSWQISLHNFRASQEIHQVGDVENSHDDVSYHNKCRNIFHGAALPIRRSLHSLMIMLFTIVSDKFSYSLNDESRANDRILKIVLSIAEWLDNNSSSTKKSMLSNNLQVKDCTKYTGTTDEAEMWAPYKTLFDIRYVIAQTQLMLGRVVSSSDSFLRFTNLIRGYPMWIPSSDSPQKSYGFERMWNLASRGLPNVELAVTGAYGFSYEPSDRAMPCKLLSDAAQYRYLVSSGILPPIFSNAADEFELLASTGENESSAILYDPKMFPLVSKFFDRVVYFHKSRTFRDDQIFNPLVNVAEITKRFYGETYGGPELDSRYGDSGNIFNPFHDSKRKKDATNDPHSGLVIVDDFLSPAALRELQLFCKRSMIWHLPFLWDDVPTYLGSDNTVGMSGHIILKIAEQLRKQMPDLFGKHRLQKVWGYRLMKNSSGLQMHSDNAAITVNWWISDANFNLDHSTGGLKFWDKSDPTCDYPGTIKDAVKNGTFVPSEKSMEADGVSTRRVAYQMNRFIIFKSCYLHKSHNTKWIPDWNTERINFTLLFGKRTPVRELTRLNSAQVPGIEPVG